MTTTSVPPRTPAGAPVADAHNDLLLLVARRPPALWGEYFRDTWYPQLRDGNVRLQVLAVDCNWPPQPEIALRRTLLMIEAAHRIAEENADIVALCRDGSEIDVAIATGRIALVLAIEGASQVERDVALLESFHRLGVRMVSLAHFGRSALADGSGEDAAGSRLTRAGVEALKLLESRGTILDVSHLSAAGVEHVLEIATRPMIASHSGARALFDHHRNLSDAALRGIRDADGLVCLNLFAGYLAAEPTMADVVAQLDHLVDIVGPHRVGIGADFCLEIFSEIVPDADRPLRLEGIDAESTLPGLEGPAGLPLVGDALRDAGWDDSLVRGVMGGNLTAFLRTHMPNAQDAVA
ncbi:dipeptidase. Metallo peptidase. MEROPS family M19 [Microbacterium sp. cf046]|uniref:dipeptidase n=1 Tax=Microbacterium sp. cf046 TaxID=1761803 RepID=UPI0008E3D65A|nr:membrane dipeptidase [Microbacterium sp. cf046]SFR91926.1 dipeptidase. Metallo peptidase. MEROPS family M19 [Microbacterium sp. cf046]